MSKFEDHQLTGPILVTGGLGFVGSHVAVRLLEKGIEVIIADNRNNHASCSCSKEANLYLLHSVATRVGVRLADYDVDVTDVNSLRSMLEQEQPVRCLHAAGLVRDRQSVKRAREFMDVNCTGTTNLLEALRSVGSVRHTVFVSTRSAIGAMSADRADAPVDEEHPLRPINPYGVSKAAAEMYCRMLAQ